DVQGARLSIRQEGRPEFGLTGIDGHLAPEGDGARLNARAGDPDWGPWKADGRISGGDAPGYSFDLLGEEILARPEKARRVPFVPGEPWSHVSPAGPIRVRITLGQGAAAGPVLQARTAVEFLETTLELPTLGLTARETRGSLTVEDAVVRLDRAVGRSIGGTVEANGSLDFRREPARFDLTLGLAGIDVADTPKS